MFSVGEYIKCCFDMYKEIQYDPKNKFDIIHLYNQNKKAYPYGYEDALFMKAKFFNIDSREFFEIDKEFDAINFSFTKVNKVKFFLDGSVLIEVEKSTMPDVYQRPDIVKC
jgi:hypothetical protein